MKSIIISFVILFLGIGLYAPTPLHSQTEKKLIELSPIVGTEISYGELRDLRITKYFKVSDFEYLKIYQQENRYLVEVYFNNGEIKSFAYPEDKILILKSHLKINYHLNNILKEIIKTDSIIDHE